MYKQKRTAVVYAKQRKSLEIMGENLKLAAKRRQLTQQILSDRTGLSRVTIGKIFSGDPSVSMGHYLSILSVLKLNEDIERVAADDEFGRKLVDIKLLKG